jgi:hypothetical protein
MARERNMKTIKPKAAVWIDHREAIVMVLTEAGEDTKHISSNVEKQLRRSGEPEHGPFEAQEVPADDSREKAYTGHLAHFYDEIIAQLGEVGAILILGPGEAKGELRKQLEKHPSESRSVALKTADKMTEPQLVALVRHHFHRGPARLL